MRRQCRAAALPLLVAAALASAAAGKRSPVVAAGGGGIPAAAAVGEAPAKAAAATVSPPTSPASVARSSSPASPVSVSAPPLHFEPALKRRRVAPVGPHQPLPSGSLGEDAEEELVAEIDRALSELAGGSRGAVVDCEVALRGLQALAEQPDGPSDTAKAETVSRVTRCLEIPNAERVVLRVMIRATLCELLGIPAQRLAMQTALVLWAQAKIRGDEPEFVRAEEALLNTGAKKPAFMLMLLAKGMVDLGADLDFLVISLEDTPPTGPKVAGRLGQVLKTVLTGFRGDTRPVVGVCAATLWLVEKIGDAAYSERFAFETRMAALRELRDVYRFMGEPLRFLVATLLSSMREKAESLPEVQRTEMRNMLTTALEYIGNSNQAATEDAMLKKHLSALACPRAHRGLALAQITIGYLEARGLELAPRQRAQALCQLRDIVRPRLERLQHHTEDESEEPEESEESEEPQHEQEGDADRPTGVVAWILAARSRQKQRQHSVQAEAVTKALRDISALLERWPVGSDCAADRPQPANSGRVVDTALHVRFAPDDARVSGCGPRGCEAGAAKRRRDG